MPDPSFAITSDDTVDSALDKIQQRESGGRNIRTQILGPDGLPASSASGLFQMTDPTWQDAVKYAGLPNIYPHAMDASPAEQRQAAMALYKVRGEQPWIASAPGGQIRAQAKMADTSTADTSTDSPPLDTATLDKVLAYLQPQQTKQAPGAPQSWVSLLGSALGGGSTGAADQSSAEQEAAGRRSLLNFGIGLLGQSGYHTRPVTLGEALASGLGSAQQSMLGTDELAMQQTAATQQARRENVGKALTYLTGATTAGIQRGQLKVQQGELGVKQAKEAREAATAAAQQKALDEAAHAPPSTFGQPPAPTTTPPTVVPPPAVSPPAGGGGGASGQGAQLTTPPPPVQVGQAKTTETPIVAALVAAQQGGSKLPAGVQVAGPGAGPEPQVVGPVGGAAPIVTPGQPGVTPAKDEPITPNTPVVPSTITAPNVGGEYKPFTYDPNTAIIPDNVKSLARGELTPAQIAQLQEEERQARLAARINPADASKLADVQKHAADLMQKNQQAGMTEITELIKTDQQTKLQEHLKNQETYNGIRTDAAKAQTAAITSHTEKLYQQHAKTRENLDNIDLLQGLSDSIGEKGVPLAAIKIPGTNMDGLQAAQIFGWGSDEQRARVTNAAAFQGVVQKFIQDSRAGAGLGVQTDQDARLMLQALPNVSADKTSRDAVIATLRQMQQRVLTYTSRVPQLIASGMTIADAQERAEKEMGPMFRQMPSAFLKMQGGQGGERAIATDEWLKGNVTPGTFFRMPSGELRLYKGD